MAGIRLLVFVCLLASAFGLESKADRRFIYGKFPDGFAWSSATSSYQIEGGWDADGKGKNIWDTRTETPSNIAEGGTGQIACDSYHKYKEDVQMLKAMGVGHYRFSLSWARILPDGTTNNVNQAGVDYYHNLIDELIANGIQPQVTLYHWDMPQALSDAGGFLSDDFSDWFEEYAKFAYQTYSSKVKFWITFNEPWIICILGYSSGAFAPGIVDKSGTYGYNCSRNLLLAHGKAYRAYKAASYAGKCGITLNCGYSKANDSSVPSDVEAAYRAMNFDLGWFAHPIYSQAGDWPDVMKDRVRSRSVQQNVTNRLPEFSADEIQMIKGSADFFGLNFYNGGNTVDNPEKDDAWNPDWEPNFWDDKATRGGRHEPSWTGSGSSWLFSTPELMRDILVWIKDEYNNPPLYITENGFSDKTGQINDADRIDYYKYYINYVMQAINEDKCDVKGYTAWSLMDNFEWGAGYTEKFGLHYVNFTDPNRPRVAKDSARFYTQVIKDHGFPSQSPIANDPDSGALSNSHLKMFTALVAICVYALI